MIAQLDLSHRTPYAMGRSSSPVKSSSKPTPKSRAEIATPLMHVEGSVQVVTSSHRSFFAQVLAQALREAGQGTLVVVVQLLKGGIHQGPQHPVTLSQTLDWYRCDVPLCIDRCRPETLTPQTRQAVRQLWHHIQDLILNDRYELVILDEISLAVDLGFITEGEVMELLRNRSPHVDVILTGSAMGSRLLQMADQVTEMRRPQRF